jgi:Fe-S-cluster-containing dehydrogenase component
MNRRDFLKIAAGSGAVLASSAVPAWAAPRKELSPDAVGILYDATLCIGCQSCMVNCKEVNSQPGGALFMEGRNTPPYEFRTPEPIWDRPVDLTGKTLNVIKAYKNGTGVAKDIATNGYSFVKRHCMHCVDPACVSACPVSALKKDGKFGVVSYDKNLCIGCRYCQVACPYNVPKFEWDQAFPQIRKCQLCNHRYKDNKYAACCEFCPTGASIFGKVKDLQAEAQRRLALQPGTYADFPVQTVTSAQKLPTKVAGYVRHIYGLKEGGGTQYLIMAGVPFASLGLPELPDKADAAVSEGIQHTLYKGMIAPAVLLAGLVYAAHKNSKDE